MSNTIEGPLWAGINWSADAGEGSIHDNETAEKLGFRGGTVAGDVHMNQFPPVMAKVFGEQWFERGNLSLNFKNATVDREKVGVFADSLEPGKEQTRVWMERDDGVLVCTGTASIGDHSKSELRDRDLRPCDPDELKILKRLQPETSLGTYKVFASTDKQFDRFDRGLISDPIDYYRTGSPWGDVIACPATFVEFLWGYPMKVLGPLADNAVGLFGAIEIGHVNGPFLLNRDYTIQSQVVCVGQSPQTEYVWYDTTATNTQGKLVATLRMQSRVMKASSPHYSEPSSV